MCSHKMGRVPSCLFESERREAPVTPGPAGARLRWGSPEPDLEGVVGALDVRVRLHVEGLHEVQDDPEPLLQEDAVGATGEFGVWLWVFGAADHPRPFGEDLARAQGWGGERTGCVSLGRPWGLCPSVHTHCSWLRPCPGPAPEAPLAARHLPLSLKGQFRERVSLAPRL